MLIFGHLWMESPQFYQIDTIDDIIDTPSNSIVSIDSLAKNIELIKHCQKNFIPFCLHINSIKEAIFANSFGAKYIISSKDLAKEIMPIAQNYLFDTRVLAQISDEDEIEEMAKAGVDGVILSSSIIV
ncbi:MAG: hypothetical protein GXO60_00530 [Epsilonproteobacteria bacterium]|nr:hypothetical protein [Campylobacterota bacterium]